MHVGAIVLAGGASRRFGAAKLLHRIEGRTIIERAVAAPVAAGIPDIVVVTGAWHEQLVPILERLPVRIVYNPDWAAGMATSIHAGLRAFDPAPEVVLLCLGDQPRLPAVVIRRLLEARRTTGARIVAPAVDGVRRHPVLFDRSLIPELLAVTGDTGGRPVIARHQADLHLVPFSEPAWFLDVDTPADLAGP